MGTMTDFFVSSDDIAALEVANGGCFDGIPWVPCGDMDASIYVTALGNVLEDRRGYTESSHMPHYRVVVEEPGRWLLELSDEIAKELRALDTETVQAVSMSWYQATEMPWGPPPALLKSLLDDVRELAVVALESGMHVYCQSVI